MRDSIFICLLKKISPVLCQRILALSASAECNSANRAHISFSIFPHLKGLFYVLSTTLSQGLIR